MVTKVEKAEAQLETLAAAQQQAEEHAARSAGELEAAQASVGDRALDAQLAGEFEGVGALGQQIAQLRDDLDVARRMIDAAHGRRMDAHRALYAAQAAEKRAAASKLRREADAHEARGNELRAALEAWEECRYAPERPPVSAAMAGMQGGSLRVIRVQTPKSTVMRMQAEELEAAAVALEALEPASTI